MRLSRIITLLAMFLFSQSAFALYCGEWITENTTLTEDLDCTGHTGYPLVIRDVDITLNGNGYKIIAPDALAGVYVQGSRAYFTDLTIEVSPEKSAIKAYNTALIDVSNVNMDNVGIGVDYYYEQSADQSLCEGVYVADSSIQNSSIFGVRVTAPGCHGNASIINSNLENSQSFAAVIDVDIFAMDGLNGTSVNGSANGFLIYAREVYLQNLDFSDQDLTRDTVVVIGSSYANISNSNFSGPEGSTGIGIHICEVDEVVLGGIVANGQNVGIKISTGTSPSTVTINDSELLDNETAGIIFSELAGQPFTNVTGNNNIIGGNGNGDQTGTDTDILITAEILYQDIQNTIDPTDEKPPVACEVKLSTAISLEAFQIAKEKRCRKKVKKNKKCKKKKKCKHKNNDDDDNVNDRHSHQKGNGHDRTDKKGHGYGHYGKKCTYKSLTLKRLDKKELIHLNKTISLPKAFLESANLSLESGLQTLDDDFKMAVAFSVVHSLSLDILALEAQGLLEIEDQNLYAFLTAPDDLTIEEISAVIELYFPEVLASISLEGDTENEEEAIPAHRKRYGKGHYRSNKKGHGYGHYDCKKGKKGYKYGNDDDDRHSHQKGKGHHRSNKKGHGYGHYGKKCEPAQAASMITIQSCQVQLEQ